MSLNTIIHSSAPMHGIGHTMNTLFEKANIKPRRSKSLHELPAHLIPRAASQGQDGTQQASANGAKQNRQVVNPRDESCTLEEVCFSVTYNSTFTVVSNSVNGWVFIIKQTLRLVPEEVGFAVELKMPPDWFQKANNFQYHDRNHYVDAVLKVIFDSLDPSFNCSPGSQTALSSTSGFKQRPIMFLSFDADICTLLSQKQPRFPVRLKTSTLSPQSITNNSITGYVGCQLECG